MPINLKIIQILNFNSIFMKNKYAKIRIKKYTNCKVNNNFLNHKTINKYKMD